LSGRRAPPSPVAGVAAEGGVEARGGVALNDADGDGGAAGVGRGPIPDGLNGGWGGVCGAGLNSGSPELGEGGVAVAAAVVRSIDSGRGRGAAGTSADHGCCGGAAARGVAGVTGAGDDGAAGVRSDVSPKIAVFQSLFGGVGRGVACAGWFETGDVRWLPVGGVFCPVGAGIEITPPQTEQRARTPAGGTFAGSTRKIERQSGQLTFIHSLRSFSARVSQEAPAELHVRHCVYPQYKPSREGSWRRSSSLSQVGSPGGRRSTYVGGS
jgi:hypothetical protein